MHFGDTIIQNVHPRLHQNHNLNIAGAMLYQTIVPFEKLNVNHIKHTFKHFTGVNEQDIGGPVILCYD